MQEFSFLLHPDRIRNEYLVYNKNKVSHLELSEAVALQCSVEELSKSSVRKTLSVLMT